jgi:hypothetical protein
MDKEELKELIRQTLSESGDEKQKIIKHLIKKGANPKDAKKDVDKHYDYVSKKYKDASISKKAEVIVSLHEAFRMLTEKEANYSEAELKQVAQFTDRNNHILARHYIAKNGSYEVLRKAYQALHDLQSALGHSPRGADKIIADLDKDLKKYISKDIPNWQEVWKRL